MEATSAPSSVSPPSPETQENDSQEKYRTECRIDFSLVGVFLLMLVFFLSFAYNSWVLFFLGIVFLPFCQLGFKAGVTINKEHLRCYVLLLL